MYSKNKMHVLDTLLLAGSNFFLSIYGYAPIVRSDSSCTKYGGQCLDDRYYDCSGSHNCPEESCGWQSGLCDGDREYGKSTKNKTNAVLDKMDNFFIFFYFEISHKIFFDISADILPFFHTV